MIKKSQLAKLFPLIFLYVYFNISNAYALPEVFIVKDIEIYAESIDLFDANTEAINKGIIDSFTILAKRLLPFESHWRLKSIKFGTAYEALEDMKLRDERMTAFSFSARGDFYYKDTAVKKLLNKMGLFYVSDYSKPLLIIPVIKKDNDFMIWEDEEWMSAWGNMPSEYGLLKLSYLIGDLVDYNHIEPNKVPMASFEYFSKIMKYYAVEELIIAIGVNEGDEFKLTLRHLKADSDKSTLINFKFESEINAEEFYNKVAEEALKVMDSYYKHYDSFE